MGAAKKKNRASSSDRQRWEFLFNALKQMFRKQAAQCESLLEERKNLQEWIQLQAESWHSDVRLLEDVISQTQRQLSLSELDKLVEITKANLLVGSKQRTALCNKLKLDHVQSELNDFKAWFDILSHRCPDKEDISLDGSYESLQSKGGSHSTSKKGSKHHSELEKEVVMLKRDYEKLSLKHKSDVSAFQDENHFVWNQYKAMESSYTNQLQVKNDEINRANEKIANLLTNMDQMQSAVVEKEETVATLRANMTKWEDEVKKKDGELSKLSKELESLRHCINESSSFKSRGRGSGRRSGGTASEEEATSFTQLEATIKTLNVKVSELEAQENQKNDVISALSKEIKLLRSKSLAETPALRRCSTRPSSSRSSRRENVRGLEGTALKEGTSSSGMVSEQGGRQSKRKHDGNSSIEDTPRLFTSQFKVPKLRSQSPRGR